MLVDQARSVPEDVQIRAEIEQGVRRFEALAANPSSEVAQIVSLGMNKGLATPETVGSFTREMGVLSAITYAGVRIVKDVHTGNEELIGREAYLEDLDLPAIANQFGMDAQRLGKVAEHLVVFGVIKSKKKIAEVANRPQPGTEKVVSFFPAK